MAGKERSSRSTRPCASALETSTPFPRSIRITCAITMGNEADFAVSSRSTSCFTVVPPITQCSLSDACVLRRSRKSENNGNTLPTRCRSFNRTNTKRRPSTLLLPLIKSAIPNTFSICRCRHALLENMPRGGVVDASSQHVKQFSRARNPIASLLLRDGKSTPGPRLIEYCLDILHKGRPQSNFSIASSYWYACHTAVLFPVALNSLNNVFISVTR